MVFQAVIEARKRTDEGDERALRLLKDSQADIKKIVRLFHLYQIPTVDRLDCRLLCGDSTLKLSVVCLVRFLACLLNCLSTPLDLLKARHSS